MLKRNCLVGFLLVAVLSSAATTKIGIVSDTHIGWKGSAERLETAYRLFKSQGITNIFNLGDIADRHVDAWYQKYVEIRNRVYPEGVDEVFVYHSHDTMEFPNKTSQDSAAFAAVRERLSAKNGPYHSFELEGYPFLVYPRSASARRMEEEISAAEKSHPGKPVFVLDHMPPACTVQGSESGAGGSELARRVFNTHPRVVALSGHVHGNLMHEGKIWQGEFTAVGLASFKDQPASNGEYMVVVLELDENKAVFRRYLLSSGREYRPESPWTVTFPYDPANPQYSRERLAKETPQPAFPKDAVLKLSSAANGAGGVKCQFPDAVNLEWTSHYLVAVEDATHDHENPRSVIIAGAGRYAVPAKSRRPIVCKLNAGYFTAGEKVRIVVTPVGFYNNKGKPLSGEFVVRPEKEGRWRVVFDGIPKGAKKGEYISTRTELTFPDDVWATKPGTRYRFTFDMALDQKSLLPSTIRVVTPNDDGLFGKVMLRIDGSSTVRRYCYERDRPDKKGPWKVHFAGSRNRVRVDGFRIEVAEPKPTKGP